MTKIAPVVARVVALAGTAVVVAASPAWAFESGGSMGRSSAAAGHRAGFGHHHGARGGYDAGHRGLHVQDRIGRAFTSHHGIGSRFTFADPANRGMRHHGSQRFSTSTLGPDSHLHHTPDGRLFWHSPDDGRRDHGHPADVTILVPPRVVTVTPFFCEPCGVGFAGEGFFHRHVCSAHGVAADDAWSSVFDVDGRWVYGGP
jgi:hypothetical protein